MRLLPVKRPAGEHPSGFDQQHRLIAVVQEVRAELIAAAGPEGAERRAELLRQARPFEVDGFPVPLDRRRLSSRALAWSAAVAVLIAIGLLVALPARSAGVAPPSAPDGEFTWPLIRPSPLRSRSSMPLRSSPPPSP